MTMSYVDIQTIHEQIQVHHQRCDLARKKLADFKYPEGPWMTEPDRVEFKHAGFNCLLLRSANTFSWCGYVGIEKDHPYRGRKNDDYSYGELEVHGGVTYFEPCRGAICHIPKPGEADHLTWIGFDCAHFMDLMPLAEALLNDIPGFPRSSQISEDYRHYRTLQFVKSETESLAEQLKAMVG